MWHKFRANARTQCQCNSITMPFAINHLDGCWLNIETYPKSQSVLFCYFSFFVERSLLNAHNTHTQSGPRYGGSAHTHTRCGVAFRRSYSVEYSCIEMNDEFIGVSLHISLHSRAACNVGKCVNRYRVLRSLPSFTVASPPFIIIVVCCFEF